MTKRSLDSKIFFFSGALLSGVILNLTQSWALDYCSGAECKAHEIAMQREALTGSKNRPELGKFDFYVLALTWTAEFCQRNWSASQQCAENKNLGFVVHGLWPQYYHGYPLYCTNEIPLSPNNMIQALKLFPTERLVRYEWRKHGICSGKTPHKYLEDVSTAQNLFKIPQGLVNPKNDQTMSLKALYWDFLKVNPSLHPGMFSINCRHGVLTEVRVCISQDMRHYQLCPQVLRQSCRTSDIFIPSFH